MADGGLVTETDCFSWKYDLKQTATLWQITYILQQLWLAGLQILLVLSNSKHIEVRSLCLVSNNI